MDLNTNPLIGLALRGARKLQSLSVHKASEKVGVSAATVKRWEAGIGLPGRSELDTYFDQLGTPQDSPYRQAAIREFHLGESLKAFEGRPLLNILRLKRRRLGLTVAEVAVASGICPASIHRYETGERTPTEDVLSSMARACGISQLEFAHLSARLNGAPSVLKCEGRLSSLFAPSEARVHLFAFERLETLLKNPQSGDYWQSGIEIVEFLLMTGDHHLALEIGYLIQSHPLKPEPTDLERTYIYGWMTLGKLTTGAPRQEVDARLQQLIKKRSHSTSSAIKNFLGGLISQLFMKLGEIEQARFWVNESMLDTHADWTYTRELFGLALDFQSNPQESQVMALQQLREEYGTIVQKYTTDAIILNMVNQLGAIDETREQLGRCQVQEDALGVGSPTVHSIRQKLI